MKKIFALANYFNKKLAQEFKPPTGKDNVGSLITGKGVHPYRYAWEMVRWLTGKGPSAFPWKYFGRSETTLPSATAPMMGKPPLAAIRNALVLLQEIEKEIGSNNVVDSVIALFDKGDYYNAEHLLTGAISHVKKMIAKPAKGQKRPTYQQMLEYKKSTNYPNYFPKPWDKRKKIEAFLAEKDVGTIWQDERRVEAASRYPELFNPRATTHRTKMRQKDLPKDHVQHMMSTKPHKHTEPVGKGHPDFYIKSPGFAGHIEPPTGGKDIYDDPNNAVAEAAEIGHALFLDQKDKEDYWRLREAFERFKKEYS